MIPLKTAIADEDRYICQQIQECLMQYSTQKDIDIDDPDIYTDCATLYNTDFTQKRYDLVFMDIYMEKENGIDAAQKLRKFDKDCLLVFTTTSTDHALEGFRVRALHYLVKPYSDEELDMLLDEISQKISVEEKYIEIPSASDLLRIKLCDILYAEHFKHCIHIHCTDKSEKSVRSTFAEFVMLFDDGDNFFVCNRGIIVNLEHIRDMNGNEFVLDNGEKISISRSLVKSAKSTFGEYIFGRRDLH